MILGVQDGGNREINKNNKYNSKGFTLIEVIIALAIVSLLALTFTSQMSNSFVSIMSSKEKTSRTIKANAVAEFISSDLDRKDMDYALAYFNSLEDDFSKKGYISKVVINSNQETASLFEVDNNLDLLVEVKQQETDSTASLSGFLLKISVPTKDSGNIKIDTLQSYIPVF